jgi:tetraacyldisaccharide 4'-kinase
MSDVSGAGAGLGLAAAIYGRAVALRNALYDRGLLAVADSGLPAISVGNLPAGGVGKTPLVLHLARALLRDRVPVGVLSRGYGRRERGPRLVLPGAPLPGPAAIGDEPWLLRARLPGLALGIDARRARVARLLAPHLTGGCFLLDDGFQHRGLARALDVVAIATGEPFAGGHLLPRGRMREPAAAIQRASHVVLIDPPAPGVPPEQVIALRRELSRLAPGIPLARARPMLAGFRSLWESGAAPGAAAGAGTALLGGAALPAPVLAVAGIARPERLLATLAAAEVPVAGRAFFRDHHPFTAGDGAAIRAAAAASGARAIVTTEKDEPRIIAAGGSNFLNRSPAFVAVIDLAFTEGEAELLAALGAALGRQAVSA